MPSCPTCSCLSFKLNLAQAVVQFVVMAFCPPSCNRALTAMRDDVRLMFLKDIISNQKPYCSTYLLSLNAAAFRMEAFGRCLIAPNLKMRRSSHASLTQMEWVSSELMLLIPERDL